MHVIKVSAEEVEQHAASPGPVIRLRIEREGKAEFVAMPFASLMRLYELTKGRTGQVDVRVEFNGARFSFNHA